MARDGIYATYGIRDAKVFPLTDDPSGGSPTYGAGVDCPGIQEVSMSEEFINAELKGDDQTVAVYSKPDKITGTIRIAKDSYPMFAAILGGTVTNSGSSPNEKIVYKRKGTDLPGYFKLEGQATLADNNQAGDSHMILYKCKITGVTRTRSGEGFGQIELNYMGIPLDSTGDTYDLEENETAVSISTSADTTPPTVSSTSPADAEVDVAVGANVTITFSEAMRLSTVSDPGAYAFSKADGTAVAFAVSYNDGTHTVTLNPSSDLAAASVYIVHVTTFVQDLAGNRLAANHVFNFTTA